MNLVWISISKACQSSKAKENFGTCFQFISSVNPWFDHLRWQMIFRSPNGSTPSGSLLAHSPLCFGNLINPSGRNYHLHVQTSYLLLLAITYLLLFRFIFQSLLYIYTPNSVFLRQNSPFFPWKPKPHQDIRILWMVPPSHRDIFDSPLILTSYLQLVTTLCRSTLWASLPRFLFFPFPLLLPQFRQSWLSVLWATTQVISLLSRPSLPKFSHIILIGPTLQFWSRASKESSLQTKLYTKVSWH